MTTGWVVFSVIYVSKKQANVDDNDCGIVRISASSHCSLPLLSATKMPRPHGLSF